MGSLSHLSTEFEDPGDAVSDPQTFEEFFTGNRRALSSYLRRRMSSDADVQEVVQEAYARILSYGYGCSRPPVVWKALLYRIATNLVHSRGRMDKSHNKAGHSSVDDIELASEEPSQERVVAAQQELAIVRQTILDMTPKCRKVFLLSRTHRKTYPEIADICGISVKMVEKYISQALAALRRELGGRA
jgi:RNA polymerase sigma-70 factor (ECF subfamily)